MSSSLGGAVAGLTLGPGTGPGRDERGGGGGRGRGRGRDRGRGRRGGGGARGRGHGRGRGGGAAGGAGAGSADGGAARLLLHTPEVWATLQPQLAAIAAGDSGLDSTARLLCAMQQWSTDVQSLAALDGALDTPAKRAHFFERTLPVIARYASRLRHEFPTDGVAPEIMLPGLAREQVLRQPAAASLLASMFLCTLPSPGTSVLKRRGMPAEANFAHLLGERGPEYRTLSRVSASCLRPLPAAPAPATLPAATSGLSVAERVPPPLAAPPCTAAPPRRPRAPMRRVGTHAAARIPTVARARLLRSPSVALDL